MTRLKRYAALSAKERGILWRSVLLLPIASALLWAMGMATAIGFFRRLDGGPMVRDDSLSPFEIARLAYAAAAILRVGCLPRSVVLCYLLRNCGGTVEIRFGVSKPDDNRITVHAWVELDGHPLNEGAGIIEGYRAMPSSADRFRISHA